MNRTTLFERAERARIAADFRGRQLVLGAIQQFATPASAPAGIARLAAQSGGLDAAQSPIFLLAAGWRTGSTMLQRMLNAVPGTLIWGEPYSEGAIVQRLTESLAFLDPEHGRFHGRVLAASRPMPDQDEWIANLTPSLDNLAQAQRVMLDRLFGQPALDRGCARWGVKEVVWGRAAIDLLTMLYPGARFILLVRDPVTQWRSYRPMTRRPWFYRWPDSPIGSPRSFGRMWSELVGDFAAADRDLPHATLVRYEDLRSADELERLSDFLGLESALRSDLSTVGSSTRTAFFSDSVPAWEQAVIRRYTASGVSRLGYGEH